MGVVHPVTFAEVIMKNIYTKYIRLFYGAHIAAFIIFFAVLIALCLTTGFSYEIIFPLFGGLIVALAFVRRLLRKKMVATFYADQNAVLFVNIVNKRFFGFNITDKLALAELAGDYQTAVNIAVSQLKNKKTNIILKYKYLSTLICAYFDIRDFGKVKILLKKYDEYLRIYPTNDPPINRDYYWSFVNRDFDSCIEMCSKFREKIAHEDIRSDIVVATNSYFTAIALYEKGEVEEAKQLFESAISAMPSNHFRAPIIKKYLDAIENGRTPAIVPGEIVPQADVIARDKRRRTLSTVLKVVLSCIFVCIIIYSLANSKDEWTVEYEEKLNTALLKTYDDAEVIDYFWLEKDGETLDNLCLIETDGKLALLSVTTPDNGITAETWVIIDDIIPRSGDCKYGMCVSSENNIKINFSTEKPTVEPLYYSVRVKYKGTKYWFYIDYYKNMHKFN